MFKLNGISYRTLIWVPCEYVFVHIFDVITDVIRLFAFLACSLRRWCDEREISSTSLLDSSVRKTYISLAFAVCVSSDDIWQTLLTNSGYFWPILGSMSKQNYCDINAIHMTIAIANIL